MCWMAAIPIAMAGAQTLVGQKEQNKAIAAQTNASRLQAIEMVKETNINNANARLQQVDAFDSASQELTAQNMQKLQAMGTIRAAIGESNLEGNSLNRVASIKEGEFIRSANSVTDQYRRDYASLFAQQLGASQSTNSQIKAMQNAEQKPKSKLATALELGLNVGTSAASQYAQGAFKSTGSKAGITAAQGTKTGR